MAKPFKALLAGSVVGAVAWAFREYQKGQEQSGQAVIMPAAQRSTPQEPNLAQGFLSSLAAGLFDVIPEPVQRAVAPVTNAFTPAPAQAPAVYRDGTGAGRLDGLLSLIKAHESGGNYNIVWGGISRQDQPPRPLTQMTIAQVLAWQDSIDSKYNSEASGAYQIMEDTLRGLYGSAGMSGSTIYNPANQDRLAIQLLNRRGLKAYLAGSMTAQEFGQNIAKEWASFPAQTRDKRGRPATGQSYYAGDGLNKSSTSKAKVLAIIKGI